MNAPTFILIVVALRFFPIPCLHADSPIPSADVPEGWTTLSPRSELRPAFSFQPTGGRSGRGAYIIQHDARDGLDGAWKKTFPVRPGGFYRLEAYRSVDNVYSPRRSAMVRLLWKMGIDPSQVLHTNTGRPIQLVNGGRVIKELFA